jgi:hypothetical protein
MNTNDKKSQPFGLRFLSAHARSVRTGIKAGLVLDPVLDPTPGHGAVSCDIMRMPSGALTSAT